MQVEQAILREFPKAVITEAPAGLRVKIPGSGRGRAGGPWALVISNNGVHRFKQGLFLSPMYDNPDDLVQGLVNQFSKMGATYT
jgi:hypothetical protein